MMELKSNKALVVLISALSIASASTQASASSLTNVIVMDGVIDSTSQTTSANLAPQLSVSLPIQIKMSPVLPTPIQISHTLQEVPVEPDSSETTQVEVTQVSILPIDVEITINGRRTHAALMLTPSEPELAITAGAKTAWTGVARQIYRLNSQQVLEVQAFFQTNGETINTTGGYYLKSLDLGGNLLVNWAVENEAANQSSPAGVTETVGSFLLKP